jgi:hypothetical protein
MIFKEAYIPYGLINHRARAKLVFEPNWWHENIYRMGCRRDATAGWMCEAASLQQPYYETQTAEKQKIHLKTGQGFLPIQVWWCSLISV